MKIFKFVLAVFFITTIFSIEVFAEESGEYKEYYKRQYESSTFSEAENYLDSETKELLESLEIDISDIDSIKTPDAANVFSVIVNCIKNGIEKPLSSAVSIMGIMLIFSLINATVPMEKDWAGFSAFLCLACGIVLLNCVSELIHGTETVLKGLSGFLLVFIPVLAAVTTSAGYATISSGMSTMLIGAVEIMSQFVSFGFVPVVGGIMCLGVAGSVSPFSGISKVCEIIKKGAIWCMGIATTVFSGVLSMQTSVATATDSIGIKTSKTIISGILPVMGPAISETLGTAGVCLGLLRSGVGIYGGLAIALAVLPMVISLICWRVVLWICEVLSEILEIKQVFELFKAVDFCLAILVGALIFVAMLFIISITIVTKAG